MGNRELFDGLSDRLTLTPDNLHALGQFYRDAELARKERKKCDAVERALQAGIDFGISICRAASEADGQWSEPRTKKEWRAHFGRQDWRTIKQHIRVRQLTSKYVQVHIDDLKKVF